jgi:RNA polymerase sigma factor (sigma-70 family)
MYLEHLPTIDRIAEALCRRNGIRGADAEDFTSEVRLRLLQDDYAVLRKYRGASSITTFLTVVIANLFRDYRIRMWGKWRPSAEARRQGEVAVLLETAVYRDGRSFEEACTALEQSGRVKGNRTELRAILNRLPHRTPRRVAEDDAKLADVPGPEAADGDLLERERRAELTTAEQALRRAVARLDPEDQLIIRLRFFEGMSVADLAEGLGLPQKPLYPRIQRLLTALSVSLSSEGIGREYLESLNSPDS